MLPDPKKVVRIVIDLYGGREIAWKKMEADFNSIEKRWDQDFEIMGRILRAHLFVEHYLGEYLIAKNPNLSSLDKARLSFSQKLTLLTTKDTIIKSAIPGIRYLNALRNRLAHTLHASLSKKDAQHFLSDRIFCAMREARVAPAQPSSDPIDILEEFARHAGSMLHIDSSETAKIWAQAFHLAQQAETETKLSSNKQRH